MKHKQTQPFGCGLYAVANACNIDNFITEERLEASKEGIVIGQLSLGGLALCRFLVLIEIEMFSIYSSAGSSTAA